MHDMWAKYKYFLEYQNGTDKNIGQRKGKMIGRN